MGTFINYRHLKVKLGVSFRLFTQSLSDKQTPKANQSMLPLFILIQFKDLKVLRTYMYCYVKVLTFMCMQNKKLDDLCYMYLSYCLRCISLWSGGHYLIILILPLDIPPTGQLGLHSLRERIDWFNMSEVLVMHFNGTQVFLVTCCSFTVFYSLV